MIKRESQILGYSSFFQRKLLVYKYAVIMEARLSMVCC
jgi:hypothetical protein